jgi:hypothetical protein
MIHGQRNIKFIIQFALKKGKAYLMKFFVNRMSYTKLVVSCYNTISVVIASLQALMSHTSVLFLYLRNNADDNGGNNFKCC